MFLENRNDKKISQINDEVGLLKEKIQKNDLNLEALFNSGKLFQGLSKDSLYTKSFEEFNEQFSSKGTQVKLYNALKDDGLYTKSQSEFLNQYFTYPKNDIEPELKELLYKAKDKGASNSQLNEIIYRYSAKNNDSNKENIKKLEELNAELKNRKKSFFNSSIQVDDIVDLGILILSIVFGLRYLIYATRWSFTQLKK